MSTRYEHLKGRHDILEKEMYSGMWHGHLIEFERVFRGHRFTSEECEALCRGELIEVHNLSNRGVLYGVAGGLEESVWKGVSQEFRTVKFKVKTSVINNPHYVYHTPYVEAVSNQQSESFVDTAFHVDMFSDELDAEMAAMIASPTLPPIQRVESQIPGVAMFVPVLNFEDVSNVDDVQVVEEKHPVWDTLYEQMTEGMSHDVRVEEGLDVDDEDLIDEDEVMDEEESVSDVEDLQNENDMDSIEDEYEEEYDSSEYEEEPPDDISSEDDVFGDAELLAAAYETSDI